MVQILYLAFVLLLAIYQPLFNALLFRGAHFVVPHSHSNPAEGKGYEHFECQIRIITKILEKPH